MTQPFIKLPQQPVGVGIARTHLKGKLGTMTEGIGPNHVIVQRGSLKTLLEWLDTLDTLAGVK